MRTTTKLCVGALIAASAAACGSDRTSTAGNGGSSNGSGGVAVGSGGQTVSGGAGGSGGQAASGGTGGQAASGGAQTGGVTGVSGGDAGPVTSDGGADAATESKPALSVTAVNTFASDAGLTEQAADFSRFDVTVLVYDSVGKTFSSHPPVITGPGKFKVDTLPPGDRYVRYSPLGQTPAYYVTTGATFDLGTSEFGRPDKARTAAGTKLAFNVTNLEPWGGDNIIQFFSLGAGAADFDLETAPVGAPNAGDTSLSGLTIDYANRAGANVIDGSKGDKAYLTEMDTQPLGPDDGYWSLARVFSIPSFTTADGSTTTVSGAFTTETLTTQDVDWKKTAFDAVIAAGNPTGAVTNRTLGGASQPHAELGSFTASLDLFQYPAIDGTDLVATFTFADPFEPAWSLFVVGLTTFTRDYSFGGATAAPFNGFLEARVLPKGALTLTPVISCALNAKVQAKDLLVNETGVTTTPTVTFDAPATGTPTGYELDVYRLSSSAGKTAFTLTGTLVTAERSVVVPPGILTAGGSYVFVLRAFTRGSVDANRQPLMYGFPVGTADVLSGVIQP